jgi:hypothetical protein
VEPDIQEAAGFTINHNDCGQARFADQRLVSRDAGRKVEPQRSEITGQAVKRRQRVVASGQRQRTQLQRETEWSPMRKLIFEAEGNHAHA